MNKKKISLFFLTVLLLLTTPVLPVHAEEGSENEDVTMAPYFLVVSEDTTVDHQHHRHHCRNLCHPNLHK